MACPWHNGAALQAGADDCPKLLEFHLLGCDHPVAGFGRAPAGVVALQDVWGGGPREQVVELFSGDQAVPVLIRLAQHPPRLRQNTGNSSAHARQRRWRMLWRQQVWRMLSQLQKDPESVSCAGRQNCKGAAGAWAGALKHHTTALAYHSPSFWEVRV